MKNNGKLHFRNDPEKVKADEEYIGNSIKGSLDFLDESVKVNTPDLMKLVELVNMVEERKETGKNRQFIYFLITAALMISLETYSFHVSMIFFAAVQAVAILCLLPVAIIKFRNRSRQVPGL